MTHDEKQQVLNTITSKMMDAAIDTMRQYPPEVAFEAAVYIVLFLGERSGLSMEDVVVYVREAASGLAPEDDA